MNPPTYEEISVRAYQLWESRGQPHGDEAALDCWVVAERELSQMETAGAAVQITNLERALPPEERRKARRARHEAPVGEVESPSDPEHFVVAANRAHLRVYRDEVEAGANGGPLKLVESADLPAGKQNYTDRDTDQAGRFPGGKGNTTSGGSIDERLPMQEEHQRRIATELATRLDAFLQKHPRATWDFAAGPLIHNAVLEGLTASVRQRLGRAIHKDLVKQPLPELSAHFEEELAAGQR